MEKSSRGKEKAVVLLSSPYAGLEGLVGSLACTQFVCLSHGGHHKAASRLRGTGTGCQALKGTLRQPIKKAVRPRRRV